jgi:hypothetical protein
MKTGRGRVSDVRIHVCDKVWLVTNVFTKQKYTDRSMRLIVYPSIRKIAEKLDPVNGVRNVVDEEGQVNCIPSIK